ncbi:UNVERIFIED_CONTAM: hypothetical protein HDU68_010108 [Siphonaria sp. JEL0065]|nr:hypothetical protein HDU68_010108 [Siphonaria sp. JEL0065]
MKSPLLALLSATAAVLASNTSLSVTGTGSASLPADLAHVVVIVNSLESTAIQAQQSTSANASSVLASLHSLNANKISTDSISLSETYDYSGSTTKFIGFTSKITISFETAPNVTGTTIDTVLANGVSQINSISFLANDVNNDKAQEQATSRAVQDAVTQANTVAAQLKMCVASITSINLNPQQQPHSPIVNFKSFSAAAAPASTPVESSDVRFSASVDVVFVLGSNCQ